MMSAVSRASMRAVASGVLLGAMARLVMRGVALEADVPTGFSIGGSLEVVGFGAMVGTPVALLFALVRARVDLSRPWLGAIVGALVFGVLATLLPPSAASALRDTPDAPVATAVSFGVMFVVWGMLMDLLMTARAPTHGRGR
jgi:hypothetical protein